MKRKTAHANVPQAAQLRVIWAMMMDLSKENATPFTGVAAPRRKAALRRDSADRVGKVSLRPAQESGLPCRRQRVDALFLALEPSIDVVAQDRTGL